MPFIYTQILFKHIDDRVRNIASSLFPEAQRFPQRRIVSLKRDEQIWKENNESAKIVNSFILRQQRTSEFEKMNLSQT